MQASEFFAATGDTGTGSLNVPLILDLYGRPLHSEALVLDAGAGNAAGATISNASIGTVGL